jgi:hypothetical protein
MAGIYDAMQAQMTGAVLRPLRKHARWDVLAREGD